MTPNPSSLQMMTDRHRPERPSWLAEPVLSEPTQPDRPEALVDETVELEQLAQDDPDHGNREDEGQEDRPAMEAPAAEPLVEKHREKKSKDDQDGHGKEEARVVAESGLEGRIGPGQPEVRECPRPVVRARRLYELDHRVAEDEDDDRDCGGDPDDRLGTPEPEHPPSPRARKGHGTWDGQDEPPCSVLSTGSPRVSAKASTPVRTVATTSVSSTALASSVVARPLATASARLPGRLVQGSVRRK
jgi:hypothetical protein